jgi:AraC-like DNA-binding protein/mannose-6-phosphate isomerase-like protein (cupin superfamily)
MDLDTLKTEIYKMNEDELFYRKYYYAKQQEYSLNKFLTEVDMNYVHRRNLLIPEKPETIPLQFEDTFFFDMKDDKSIEVLKHNRFSPPIHHSHTFFELFYVYNGTCKQNINQRNITLQTGDICIVPPGVTHNIEVFDESIVINVLMRKSTLHNIFFNFLRIPNILSAFFLNNIYSKNGTDFIIFHTGNDTELKEKFIYMLWESINKNIYYYQMISNTIMLIFGLLIRNYETSVDMPTFTHKADVQRFALLQFIQDNFANINLDDVAERFHYTPEYTSKLIKSTTGMTFTQILQQVRIERAQILLQDTNLSIANIGNQIGYETTEHFIRTFKKVNHVTPAEYRRSGYHI